ncbi:hypothetical protein [Escherichia coli]|nr:hypothetical protein [Escherichia coli]
MVEVIRWYQIWLIEFVLDVSWVMRKRRLSTVWQILKFLRG